MKTLLIIIFFVACSLKASAQSNYSISAVFGTNWIASPGMSGDLDSFNDALEKSGSYLQFPFKDRNSYAMHFGVKADYLLPKTDFKIYGSGVWHNYQAGLSSVSFDDFSQVKINAITLSAGTEYWFEISEYSKVFIGGGLNTSTFFGNLSGTNYSSGTPEVNDVDISASQRLGFEANTGLSVTLPFFPQLALEGSLYYANLNFIGKSYTAPSGNKRDLNDGKNSANPYDKDKTFGLITLHYGIRFSF